MKLTDLKDRNFPQSYQVSSISGPELVVERLHELGFHKGCQISVLGVAPLKGPLLVEYNSTVVALRDEESSCLSVQPL